MPSFPQMSLITLINEYLNKFNIISEYQSGFQQKRATLNAITLLTNEVRKNVDKKLHLKAFSTPL